MVIKPKGTYDVFGLEMEKWVRLENILRRVCKIYNFKEIRTPVIEYSELFHRDSEQSDMVTKETYDFLDRSGRSLTLRPEGTAGVARAYIENKLYANSDINKLFYIFPVFRYERPQKGRYRGFYQFGVEALGSASPLMDAEVIALGSACLTALGLKGVKVRINTIGDKSSRDKYRTALTNYFKEYEDSLCQDCKNRLYSNPLRILDCKVCRDEEFFKNAPKIKDYLNEESKEHFDKVLAALDRMNVSYEINENLVRGLDYYSHTVFELEADIKDFGSQNVLCGGGRYDDLISELDGPKTPCVGFSFGLERLMAALDSEERILARDNGIHLYIMALGEKAQEEGQKILNACRLGGLISEMDYFGKSLKSQFKLADRYGAKFTAILGDTELENNVINIKDNTNDTQETIPLESLYSYVLNKVNEKPNPCASCSQKKGE